MTLTETRLLQHVMLNNGQSCSHLQLGVAVGLQSNEFDKHRIEVMVSRLRSKIQRITGSSVPIVTDRNLGYRWAA